MPFEKDKTKRCPDCGKPIMRKSGRCVRCNNLRLWTGRPKSAETREKSRISHLGKVISPETRAKMSEAQKARGCEREKNPAWKGGRVMKHDYITVYAPDHPKNVGGYVYEHRLVMEKILGRYLTDKEKVHHRNGIRTDNRPENLQIISTPGPHYVAINCPYCQQEFVIQ